MNVWPQLGPALRGPQFLLDDPAARHIEAFLNHARLVLVGCLLVLGNVHLLPGTTDALLLTIAGVGVAWVIVVALLTRYAYRPWVAIAVALVDTLAVSLLVYRTGGPDSPLDALYGILIFAAAIRFTRIHSLLLTVSVILAYVEVTWFHPAFSRQSNANAVATSSIILAATGVLAWLVSAEVARQRRAVVEAQGKVAGLTLINEIAGRFQAAHDFQTVFDCAVDLVKQMVAPRSVTLAAPSRSESSTQLLRTMWAQQCAEIVATPIGPAEQPLAWLYVGTAELQPLTAADRALIQRIAEEAAGALERNSLLERERERSESLARVVEENDRLLETERETVARLRQLATHKEGFIDMIAHELRTPLTSVKGFAQLLLRGPGMANGRRYVELILGESNRLMRIIDDIVDLSRMERGLLEMRREPIALADVVDRAVELLGPNGVALRVNLPTDLPRLRGDPDKLCQTVVNLAQAASVYHQGAEPMDVTADASGSAVTLCLDVVGTIPEHRLAHVFDRLPSGAEPTPTGLSLYIAKNFVEAHGGRLRLETHPGRGRLLMTLPFAEGAPPPLRRAARADGRPRHVGVGPRRALGPRHAPRQSDPDQSP
jgi:signal transduction histidine kinase